MTAGELRILEVAVGGSFHQEEVNGLLVFGSHTFPSYRITVSREDAERYLLDVTRWQLTDVGNAD